MRTVAVSTSLDADADTVFRAVQTPEVFVHVTRGMLRFPAARLFEGPLVEGAQMEGWTWLFGVIPFSRHRIRIEHLDPDRRRLQSDEGGGLVRTWRHLITVEEVGADRCRYTDVIEIDAGPLTPVVVAFAHVFYRYRQRRWRHLAPVLAALTRP